MALYVFPMDSPAAEVKFIEKCQRSGNIAITAGGTNGYRLATTSGTKENGELLGRKAVSMSVNRSGFLRTFLKQPGKID